MLGSAVGSKDLVQKILGPTADYLGAGLADWTERPVKNTGRVFEKRLQRNSERKGKSLVRLLPRCLRESFKTRHFVMMSSERSTSVEF